MVNAHPTIIYQYCKKHNIECRYLEYYVNNREDLLSKIQTRHEIDRDAAKKLILRLVYLGDYVIENNGSIIVLDNKLKTVINFKNELVDIAKQICVIEKETYEMVKKDTSKLNKKSTVLSITAQIIEHKCLMALCHFLQAKDCHVGVLCFDGLMVGKKLDKKGEHFLRPSISKAGSHKKVKEEISRSLRLCEEEIANKTGYNIKLEIKQMNTELSFELPLYSHYVCHDRDAQEKLFKIEGKDKFKFCGGDLYIFDEFTGMYDTRIETLWYYLSKNSNYLNVVLSVDKKTGEEKTDNYGQTSALMNKVVPFVKMAAKDEEWLFKTENTSLGYLLFKDGIYNMKTGEFKAGFDPDIVFHCRVPWKFPKYDKKNIDYAMDVSFNRLFTNPKPMIAALACALAGDIGLKRFYFCPGYSNSGKSRFVNMLKNAFGKYVGSFNAESLAVSSKMDTKDEAAKFRWALINRFCRILVSNEIKMEIVIDGNAVKKIASGGDKLIGRTHCKEEVEFTLHGTPFCMLNDIPPIDPMDQAVVNRNHYVEFSFVFVKKEEVGRLPYYKELDPKLDDIMKSKSFIKGFIHIILDGYKDYLENGMPEFDQELKNKWTEDSKQNDVVVNAIKEIYEITNDPEDKIDVRCIQKLKKKCKDLESISIQRINEVLSKDLGLIKGKSRDGYFWKGIRKIIDNKDYVAPSMEFK
jgi:phage/plasmid-associated DNA primase